MGSAAAGLLRCVCWFNPLVWLACHRLRQTGEPACDGAALSTGMAAPLSPDAVPLQQDAAAATSLSGTALDATGKTVPDAAFVEAALGAIRQRRFTPAKLNGVPQECQVTVTVKFVAR